MSGPLGMFVGVVLAILILALAWIAYTSGFLTGQEQEDQGIEVRLGSTE
jgi:hypothetical protein